LHPLIEDCGLDGHDHHVMLDNGVVSVLNTDYQTSSIRSSIEQAVTGNSEQAVAGNSEQAIASNSEQVVTDNSEQVVAGN
ncbi:hypothetical protein, partial [Ehrlichia ruminantium]